MLKDSHYIDSPFKVSERTHAYGKNVHLLSDPYHESLIARFSVLEAVQPEANRLTSELSRFLLIQSVNLLFPQVLTQVKTRMATYHPEAQYEAKLLSNEPKAVVVDLMRKNKADKGHFFGTLPNPSDRLPRPTTLAALKPTPFRL